MRAALGRPEGRQEGHSQVKGLSSISCKSGEWKGSSCACDDVQGDLKV